MPQNTKVLVVDDHPLFRDALELALIKSGIMPDAIQCQSTIAGAAQAMKTADFGLVLLDLNLPDSTGFEGLSKIKAAGASGPVIVVSATETQAAYATAQSLGASGYIPKSRSLDEITAAVKTVLSGAPAFPDISDNAGNDAAAKLAALTPAQHRVMMHLSEGLLNKQIAFEMSISEATVKAHMTAIFRKLGANNRTQALLIFRDATRL